MQLRRPELSDKAAVLDMIAEFNAEASALDGLWNFATGETTYEEWLEANLRQEMGLSTVPAIQFVSFDERGRALGFLSLRLRLTASLQQVGGHIGYSIRPSERGKGYAKKQLGYGLKIANEKNIKRALLTCHSDNPASRAVILAAGGVLEDVCGDVERYWIALEG